MTGSELRNIREAFGLSASAMGKALGYSGPRANIAVHIRRLERDARRIPPSVEKLILMYVRHGLPKE
jgi:transcriptional regulator with XRE-family HTH domain